MLSLIHPSIMVIMEISLVNIKKVSPSSPRAQAFAREEAALKRAVRSHGKAVRRRISLDDGPAGFARGSVEVATLIEVEWDAALGEYLPRDRPVIRRRSPDLIASLELHRREAAAIYLDAVEQVASVRSPGEQRGSGVSDGGAVTRCDAAGRLRACRLAIGQAVAISPEGLRAHLDRARRPLKFVDIVDGAVLHGRPLASILARAGWSRSPSILRQARAALEAALDRVGAALGVST